MRCYLWPVAVVSVKVEQCNTGGKTTTVRVHSHSIVSDFKDPTSQPKEKNGISLTWSHTKVIYFLFAHHFCGIV